MNRKTVQLTFLVALVGMQAFGMEGIYVRPAMAQDLYIKDTPLDTGIEPNPDAGPMWVSEDIWVRTTPDPNYRPQPFPEASPSWTPLAHENPEYRHPQYSSPNYVYVRVRNRGSSASSGTERLRLYWAKASTGLSWPTQWVDYVVTSGGSNTLYGAEATKPRKNAATATQAERDAYVQAILDVGGAPFLFPGGVSYWHKQSGIHALAIVQTTGHGTPAFFPWHREMLSRYELLLQEANPTAKLLYWDWTTDPTNSIAGFNFFTPNFMGAHGRGTGGTPIGSPFMPSLSPPTVSRNGASTPPPADPDSGLLGIGTYQPFRAGVEQSPNHNSAHGYIGGGGQLSFPSTAAQDPFFFLLHGNVDRLWAQWQRDLSNPVNLSRLEPATAYGIDSGNANITRLMAPWDGTSGLRPWTAADGYIVNKSSLHRSVVSPPIYDTAPLVIPVLQPGEAVVIEIPWFPPNPADFAAFGGDQGHFCLLGRIETSTTPPFGMTTQESADINANTRNNNNIAWKNITVVDNFPGALRLTSILIRNVLDVPVLTGLRFADTQEIGASFFDFGRISVDLKPELFERWRAGGARGQGIEPVSGTIIGIPSPAAFIQNIRLEPGETFSIDIQFQLPKDYRLVRGVLPKWDLMQIGTRENPEAIVGGQRFAIDISKIVLVKTGSEWRYLDRGSGPGDSWRSLDFDDSKWKLGRADLGFGNNPVTTIYGGPLSRRRITTHFRHTFEVTDPTFFRSLYLRLKRNDGVVVYLNGTEIHRVNLPQDVVTPSTLATRDVGGLEREVFFPVQVSRELLREGRNVVAVELHLASPRSQDATFDLELYANPVDTRFPPDVAFASPMNGALFQTGQAIPIQVEALDTDGKITSVSFFADGKLLGTDNDSPYTFQWEGASLGSHQLRAVATDNDQRQTMVDTVVTVLENAPPSVDLTQPGDRIVFQVGEVIPVLAQASDEGGHISRVEFYLHSMDVFADPKLVGTAGTEPFETSLRDLAPGHYMLSAVAIDDRGAASQSIPVHLHIQP